MAGDIDNSDRAARYATTRPSSRPRPAASAASRQTACTSSRAFPTAPRPPAPTASCRRASPSRGPACARRSPMPAVAAGAPPARNGRNWRRSGDRSTRSPVGEDCLTLHVWTPGARQCEAPGHGLAARRRLLLRLGQLAALRQHQPRPAQRRRGRRRQPSPQHLRPPRSVAASAASASPSPAMPACSTSSRRWNGCASTPRASAAIRATSRSSASPAAAERSARCWRCRAPRACSTRRSCRAAPACALPSASARRVWPTPC